MKIKKTIEERELNKCSKNVKYFAEKYCKIFNPTDNSYDTIKLTDNQKLILDTFIVIDKTLCVSYRNSGITTLYGIYLAHTIIFKKDFKVAVFKYRNECYTHITTIVQSIIESLPEFFNGKKEGDYSNFKINYDNNVSIKYFNTLQELRGYNPDLLLMDNFIVAKFDEENYNFCLIRRK